jgi:hypothetical protein
MRMVPSTSTKEESQVRILSQSGEIVDRRIQTTREWITAMFEPAHVYSPRGIH